jgi:hypothetical protein
MQYYHAIATDADMFEGAAATHAKNKAKPIETGIRPKNNIED